MASPTLRPKTMMYFIRLDRPPDKRMSRGRSQTSCPIFIPQRCYDPNYCFSSFIPSSTTCQAEHRTAPAVVASVPVARMEAAAPACALEERWRGPGGGQVRLDRRRGRRPRCASTEADLGTP